MKGDLKFPTVTMAPISLQPISSHIIPAEDWNKMSRADKKELFREQKILVRERKPKGEASEGAEVTVDLSTTMDTTTMLLCYLGIITSLRIRVMYPVLLVMG